MLDVLLDDMRWMGLWAFGMFPVVGLLFGHGVRALCFSQGWMQFLVPIGHFFHMIFSFFLMMDLLLFTRKIERESDLLMFFFFAYSFILFFLLGLHVYSVI